MDNTIQINGKQYAAKYSMRVLRSIVKATNCDTIEQLGEKITTGDPLVIVTIIHEGITAAGATITRDQLEDEFQSIGEITDALKPWREWFAGFFTNPSANETELTAKKEPA